MRAERVEELRRAELLAAWVAAAPVVEVDAEPVRGIGPLRLGVPPGAPVVIGARRGRR